MRHGRSAVRWSPRFRDSARRARRRRGQTFAFGRLAQTPRPRKRTSCSEGRQAQRGGERRGCKRAASLCERQASDDRRRRTPATSTAPGASRHAKDRRRRRHGPHARSLWRTPQPSRTKRRPSPPLPSTWAPLAFRLRFPCPDVCRPEPGRSGLRSAGRSVFPGVSTVRDSVLQALCSPDVSPIAVRPGLGGPFFPSGPMMYPLRLARASAHRAPAFPPKRRRIESPLIIEYWVR